MLRRQFAPTSNAPVGSNSFDPGRLASHSVRMNSHLQAHWAAFGQGDSESVVPVSGKQHKKLPMRNIRSVTKYFSKDSLLEATDEMEYKPRC
jgi:hypothetical protein